ncbi:MAG TPA: two-component regulator propeller domain-containing protein [Pyrinomonadaceae bacterium]|nr:two-component regulator propeller domain-containing protein [Pyrinomonadaceae bacterium]
MLCIWLLVCNFAWGGEVFQTPQNEKYLKVLFNTDNGLPQNSPTSIVQTPDGYLWLGTFGGLARFDGLKFTVFTTTNTPQLNSNRITALYVGSDGTLWIGSEEGNIVSYRNGIFELIRKSEGPPADILINEILQDDNGNLAIATSKGFRIFNLQTKQMRDFAQSEILKSNTVTDEPFRVTELFKDNDGKIWLITNGGLVSYKDGNFINYNVFDGLPNNIIYSAKPNQTGGLWVLTRFEFGKFENGKYTTIKKNTSNNFSTSRLLINNENHVFFTVQNNLFEFDENGTEINRIDLSEVMKSNIRAMFSNSIGQIFLGTDNGLIQLKKRNISTFSTFLNSTAEATYSVIEDREKNIWISTDYKLLKWRNGKFEQIWFQPLGFEWQISALGKDLNGNLIIPTKLGLFRFENDHFVKFVDGNFTIGAVSTFIDRQNRIWLGSSVNGLRVIEEGKVRVYTTEDGLVNNSVAYITQDRNGAIWIGTKEGMSRFENGVFTNFTVENGLSNNSVRDIYEEQDGTFWIATYGGGINRLKNGKFTVINSVNGLPEDIASRILIDDRDNFWVMGNQGIYSVSRKLLNDFADGKVKRVYCSIYNKNDGMEVSEGNGGNQPAGWKTSDGNLWFPMVRGGVIINPKIPQSLPPPVYIEEVTLNKNKILNNKTVEIQPDQQNLEINYTGINFTKPEQLQFRYKLDGYDTEWQEVGSRRVAYYAYLPPGNYKFKVLATTSDGVISPEESSLEIVVYAPFWRTWWFYLMIVAAMILLIVLAYQKRLGILKERRRNQEEFSRQLINAHESERNRIAGELHDSLGQELLIIKNWSLLVLNQISEKDKNRKQIEEISATATRALDETRSISRNLRPQYLQKFGLTETLQNMAKKVEDSAQIEITISMVNIDGLFSQEDELSIYRIVQECLNNIVKHSEAKKCELKIRFVTGNIDLTNSQEKVEIFIKDNGKGFDLASKRKTSFGLDNINQRTELLGGKYNINSTPGKGTNITITLPIK